jgi:Apea-like HEPN
LGDDEPGEINYKLQLRAALLLGKRLSERREIRKSVRNLYSLRSKVVHGRKSKAKDKLSDISCAHRGLEICTRAVRAIVHRGVAPEFAIWELTSGPQDDENI